jgi:phosphoribosyl-AMP cyclohydrolase
VTDPAAGLTFNADGLVCAVVQQHDTREVLMVAWMDAEALRRTVATGAGTYWSRSRQEYWVRRDCDGDTVLVLVDQTDGACHTGDRTCFDAGLIARAAPRAAGRPRSTGGAALPG